MSNFFDITASSRERIIVDSNDSAVKMILAWLFLKREYIKGEICSINKKNHNGLWSLVNECDDIKEEDIIIVSDKSEYTGRKNVILFNPLDEITSDEVYKLETRIENSHKDAYKQVEGFSKEYFDEVSYMPGLFYRDNLLCNRDYKSEKTNIVNGLRYTNDFAEQDGIIHFFGDSRMYGLYVADQYTIPSLVSKKIKKRCINYGTHGTSIFDISLQIEKATIKSGDIVIINNGFIKAKKQVDQGIIDEAVVREIVKINNNCISKGARFIVCMFPNCGDKNVLLEEEVDICIFQEIQKIEQANSKYFSLDANWEKVMSILELHNIQYCDVISYVRCEKRVQMFVDYIHFGPAGNELISELLCQSIVKEKECEYVDYIFNETYTNEIEDIKEDYRRIIYERRGDRNSIFFDNKKFNVFIEKLSECAEGKPRGAAVIVMNANPFTYGHLYIIEESLKLVPYLYILVVQEEHTVIPYENRIDLIKKGTMHMDNICIIPSSEFVVSNVTLPEYFNKEKNQLQNVDATRDIELFVDCIMPALKVNTRIAGHEPYCKVTKEYNRQIAEKFAEKGLNFIQLDRKKSEGEFISASKVRKAVVEGRISEIRRMVPKSTFEFLLKNQELIMDRMKNWEVV